MPCLTTVRSVNVNITLALEHVHLEIKAHKRQEAGKRVNFGTIGTKFRGQTTSKSWGLCLQNDGKSMTYTFHKEEVVEMTLACFSLSEPSMMTSVGFSRGCEAYC